MCHDCHHLLSAQTKTSEWKVDIDMNSESQSQKKKMFPYTSFNGSIAVLYIYFFITVKNNYVLLKIKI